MKRFISIFLCICLVISCLCLNAFAYETHFNFDLISNSIFCNATISLLYQHDGAQFDPAFIIHNEFLPILNHSGVPFTSASQQGLKWGTIDLTSDSNFDGYYSFYLYLEFHSSALGTIMYGNVVADLSLIGLHAGNSTYYPNVEIWDNPDPSSYSGVDYKFSVVMKWDIEANNITSFEHSASENTFLNLPYGNWVIEPINATLIKYQSQEQYEASSDLQAIAQSLVNINSSLSSYIPQIIQLLTQDNSLLTAIENNTDDLEAILNDIYTSCDDTNTHIQNIKSFLEWNFSSLGSQSPTIYSFLKYLYEQLTYPSANSDTTSLWYRLVGWTKVTYNFLDYNNSTGKYSLTTYGGPGIRFIGNIIDSINNFLSYEYKQNEALQNSAGYQTGDDLIYDINQNNGFSSLGSVAGEASSFGNIGNIGQIFNGFTSAFRWFSNETKNNIDNVPQTRTPQEPISNYYQQNQDRIFEFLETEETENDQPYN